MTNKEWNGLTEWLWGTRLRGFASTLLVICTVIAALGFVGAGIDASDDHDDAIAECDYTGEDGRQYMRPGGYHIKGVRGYCRGWDDTLVRDHDWDGVGLTFAKWTMLVGLLGFTLPMGNGALLGARGYSRSVRLRWKQSATRHVLDERSKRLKAEELSAAAERETERLERELEAMGVMQ